MVMLPQATINDAGDATTGTPYAGPYTGPDTFLESGLTYLTVDRSITLGDAIATVQNGATGTSDQHAYLISVGTLQNVVGVLYAAQLNPQNNQRVVPKLKFKPGDVLFVRAVQMSGAAAEATTLILKWNPA